MRYRIEKKQLEYLVVTTDQEGSGTFSTEEEALAAIEVVKQAPSVASISGMYQS